MENLTKQINSFLSALKTTYNQQGQIGRILLPVLFLFTFCCLCSVLVGLFRPRASPTAVPSPNLLPTQDNAATPTALFNFGTVTFAPFPTFPTSTGLPTLTPLPTLTETLTPTPTQTQILPTATGTPLPLPTVTSPPPATATTGGSVMIVSVNKPLEYVELQNLSNAPVDLQGWRLVSETGNQSCALRGVLQPNEALRVWARRGTPGLSCRFPINIWNDNQADPAVLYNAQGQEVSRVP